MRVPFSIEIRDPKEATMSRIKPSVQNRKYTIENDVDSEDNPKVRTQNISSFANYPAISSDMCYFLQNSIEKNQICKKKNVLAPYVVQVATTTNEQ